MIVGMDFGTTNTGAAFFDGDAIHLLPLDPSSSNPAICRTSIYITRGRDYHLGSAALNLYFNQNVGRPTRFKKIKVGEIIQVFAELPTFYRDVFVYEDEFSPGRLFLSIKTALRNPNYYGTVFLDNWYSASDLVAIFLTGMKLRMDKHLAEPVNEIVLGRPVRFSNDPTEDKIAQSRLLEGAFKAGFEKVFLEYEPVAAALSYERSLTDKEVVLVFDFGGGTLDFTIMEVGGASERRVLATGGIPVAGDVFDQRLFRVTIPRHLGENDYFLSGGKKYPIPAHIFDLLSNPQEVLSLNTPQNLEMLRSIHQGAIHKEKTKGLLELVSSNYILYVFDLVERAKRQLSSRADAVVSFAAGDFSLMDTITRPRFEQAIRQEYEAVREGLEHILASAGLRPNQVDRVIRTGGSSQIPLFVRLLNEMFGREKVRQIDVFSSVTSGLAIRGHEIFTGKGSLPAYLPGSDAGMEEIAAGPAQTREVLQVDLDAVRQRLEVDQDYQDGGVNLPDSTLVALGEAGISLVAAEDPDLVIATLGPGQSSPIVPEEAAAILAQCSQCLLAKPNDYLLLATNLFKLISTPLQAMWIAQQASRTGLRDQLRLETGEVVTALRRWQPENPERRYLCLVTDSGQGRALDARLLAEQLSRRPTFNLERRYIGKPVALLLAGEDDTLVAGTDLGRVGRGLVKEMQVVVFDLIKARKEEGVTAAAAFPAEEGLLALNDLGILLPFQVEGIPASGPSASRGRTIHRNFQVVGFVPADWDLQNPILAVSNQGRVYRLALPARGEARSLTSPFKAVRLLQGEKLVGWLET
jgi:hypothetical chaperone protein